MENDTKKKSKKDYEKDPTFFDLGAADESLTTEQKEEFYASWRKQMEGLIQGMKHCSMKKMMTRRDLLAKGFVAGFAAVAMPKISSKKFSFFDEAKAQANVSPVGVLTIEAYGGYVPSHQIYTGVTNPTGQSNDVKAALGIRINNTEGTPQQALGAFWKSDSQFIAAFRAALGNDANLFNNISSRTQTIFMNIARGDDNGGQMAASRTLNMQVLGAAASTAGVKASISDIRGGAGDFLETHPAALVTLTAGNTTQAGNLPGSLAVGSKFAQSFPGNSVAVNTAVMKALESLSNRGIVSKKALEDTKKTTLLANSSTFKSKQVNTPPGTNVFSSAPDANLFTQIFPNTGNDETQMALATIGHLLTSPPSQGGLRATSGFLGVGGYDSHQGSATSRADFTRLGDYVGRILRLAFARNVDCAVRIMSDGAQFQTSSGDDNWFGDDGSIGADLIFCFRAAGAPALKVANQYVLGGFQNNTVTGGGRAIPVTGSGAEFSSDVKLANEAALLNILAAYDKLSLWSNAEGTLYTPTTPGIIKFDV